VTPRTNVVVQVAANKYTHTHEVIARFRSAGAF